MFRRLSLAQKCLLLYGLALSVVLVGVLAVAWLRFNDALDDGEFEVSRQMVRLWESSARRSASAESAVAGGRAPARVGGLPAGQQMFAENARLEVYSAAQLRGEAGPGGALPARERSAFVDRAWAELEADPTQEEVHETSFDFTTRLYRYARLLRAPPAPGAGEAQAPGAPEGLIVMERTSQAAIGRTLTHTAYLALAGLVALGIAMAIFYAVNRRLIIEPIERLQQTAEAVREGDLGVRSDLSTGDEFEDMAGAFNSMLASLQLQQEQLRAINSSLEGKMTELSARNVALDEAARLKGEFLASVTHELRTPLNSVLGFAELLEELAAREEAAAAGQAAQPGPDEAARLAKRRRYVENILSAGRSLLELINGLLEMAKVEAGKLGLQLQSVALRDAGEQLLALMRPLADKRGVELRLECPEDLPPLYTDPRKFQQIVFNFLSNAIKFTADAADGERQALDSYNALAGGDEPGEHADLGPAPRAPRVPTVTLRIERLVPRTAEGPESVQRVRVSVLDNGPGIAPADLRRIFEKFTQLDTGYERRHAGTGLGLAISKTLTQLLQGEIQVHSEPGRGSMFSVILPLRVVPGDGAAADAPGAAPSPAAQGLPTASR